MDVHPRGLVYTEHLWSRHVVRCVRQPRMHCGRPKLRCCTVGLSPKGDSCSHLVETLRHWSWRWGIRLQFRHAWQLGMASVSLVIEWHCVAAHWSALCVKEWRIATLLWEGGRGGRRRHLIEARCSLLRTQNLVVHGWCLALSSPVSSRTRRLRAVNATEGLWIWLIPARQPATAVAPRHGGPLITATGTSRTALGTLLEALFRATGTAAAGLIAITAPWGHVGGSPPSLAFAEILRWSFEGLLSEGRGLPRRRSQGKVVPEGPPIGAVVRYPTCWVKVWSLEGIIIMTTHFALAVAFAELFGLEYWTSRPPTRGHVVADVDHISAPRQQASSAPIVTSQPASGSTSVFGPVRNGTFHLVIQPINHAVHSVLHALTERGRALIFEQ